MIVIPAIDIYDKKTVRLQKGDYNSHTFYKASPFEQAAVFAEYGFKRIHIIDLAASRDGNIETENIIRKIKSELSLTIEFGGGIRSADDVRRVFAAGADYIIIGTLAVTNKSELHTIAESFSIENLIIAADVKNELIRIKGWTENSGISIYEHIHSCKQLGFNNFLCTDIEKDGMLSGSSIKLYQKIMSKFPDIDLIASGGISSMDDLRMLESDGIPFTVVGKAIYENIISLKELKKYAG